MESIQYLEKEMQDRIKIVHDSCKEIVNICEHTMESFDIKSVSLSKLKETNTLFHIIDEQSKIARNELKKIHETYTFINELLIKEKQ